MTNFVCGLRFTSLAIAFALSTSAALAQSGSTGGSIGNENKSLSGSRQDRSADPAPAAPKSKPTAEEPRSAPRQSKAGGGGGAGAGGGGGGGGGGNFDGAWSVTTAGCSGAGTIAIVISSGQIIGEGLSGRVSPNGSSTSFGRWGELTSNGTGRFSGRSGSGTYRRNDGCSGSWSASKQ
jgi:hypothetical protein